MYDYFSIRDNQVTITVKVCQLYKSVITEATTRGYLLHRFLHTPQSAHEDLRLNTSQDLCYSNTLHFTNGSIKALSERQKKRRNRHQKKHYEFEAARPQFATLIRHTCDGAAFHFCVKIRNVCGDNDYSAKSSAEMRRQNEQIIPLKFFLQVWDKCNTRALTLSGKQSKKSGCQSVHAVRDTPQRWM